MDNKTYLDNLTLFDVHYLAKGINLVGRQTMSANDLRSTLTKVVNIQDLPRNQSETYTARLLSYWDHKFQKKLTNPTHSKELSNTTCGDWVKIQVVLVRGIFTEMEFTAGGCCLSECCAAITVEAMRGKSIEQVLDFSEKDLLDLVKIKILAYREDCVKLAMECLRGIIYEETSH